MMLNISLIIVLVCTFSILETDHILQINKHEIVGWHNYYRRTRGAKNMIEMDWNNSLSIHSMEYAKMCNNSAPWYLPFEVRQNRGYGVGETYNKSIKAYLEMWMKESTNYSFPSQTCSPQNACHNFKAIIKWDHDKVGCVRYHCDSLIIPGGSQENAAYFICEYTLLRENHEGLILRPYEEGVACSVCPEEYPKCGHGLCIPFNELPLVDPYDVVSAHNNIRKNQGSSNMLEMRWDDRLFENARADAIRCGLTGPGLMKNGYVTQGETIDYKEAIRSWELLTSAKMILKWNFNKVGCAAKYCGYRAAEIMNKSYFVCRYNYSSDLEADVILFKNGTPCTECAPNYAFCHNNLCSNAKMAMEVREDLRTSSVSSTTAGTETRSTGTMSTGPMSTGTISTETRSSVNDSNEGSTTEECSTCGSDSFTDKSKNNSHWFLVLFISFFDFLIIKV